MRTRHTPPSVADHRPDEKSKGSRKAGVGKGKPIVLPDLLEETSSTAPPSPQLVTPTLPESLSPPAFSLLSSSPVPLSGDTSTASEPTSTENEPKPAKDNNPLGGFIRVGDIDFHHASEAEFARLLNYYGLEWQYEPHQFPLQWRDGRPTEMFTPDFYLTEYDLYIELTTMRQSLVRRKNRKLRLLRALYPEINVKLLYRRDYQRLLERFGIRSEDIEAEQIPPLDSIERTVNIDADEGE